MKLSTTLEHNAYLVKINAGKCENALPLLFTTKGAWSLDTNGTLIAKSLARRACNATGFRLDLRDACDMTDPKYVEKVNVKNSQQSIQLKLIDPHRFKGLTVTVRDANI